MGVRVGFAVSPITPAPGVAMAGYGTRTGGALGVHDELEARAVWLEHEAGELAVVGVDLIAVDASLVDEVRAHVADLLEPNGVFVCASHTHAGPVVVRDRIGSRSDQPGAEQTAPMVAERIAAAVRRARANARPARIGVGRTRVGGLSSNRRRQDGPVDPTATVILLRAAADAEPIAAFVHYACHPTVLDSTNRLYSAEYPGAARRQIQRSTGIPAVFLQGAAGDVSTRFTRREASFEEVERLGGLLARPVVDLLPGIQTSADVSLQYASRALSLPTRPVPSTADADRSLAEAAHRFEALRESGATPAELRVAETAVFGARRTLQLAHRGIAHTLDAALAAIALDGLTLVTVPGELFTANAAEIARRAAGQQLVVIGYTNGYLGYLPAPGEEGGYELGASVVSTEGVQMLVEAAAELVTQIRHGEYQHVQEARMTAVAESVLDITNAVGLHARPAAQFVKTASRFRSRITVNRNGRTADGKSILAVLGLQAGKGSSIVVRAEGEDAEPAVAALRELVNSRFGEPE